MPRVRSPKRDEAYNLWKNSNGSLLLKDIATKLEVSDTQIRKWKNVDKWKLDENPNNFNSNVTNSKDNPKSNVTKGDFNEVKLPKAHTELEKTKTNLKLIGNQNAKGNRGGKGGPIRNKHAVKTHEYETIFWTADIIDDEERDLLNADYNKYVVQYLLVDTLKIREKRILQRIQELQSNINGMTFDSVTKTKNKTDTTYKKKGSSVTVEEDNISHVAIPNLKRIMELEEVLTRVQGKLQRAIEVLHRMEIEDKKLAIDLEKLELYKQRITGQIDLDELLDDDDLDLVT